MNLLKDVIEISIYETNNLTWGDFFGDRIEEVKKDFQG